MLLLQLTGVHIGDNVAVFSRRCRQIEYEGRIQIIQHLRAELRFCIVAFVHNNDRLQMAQHLNQRRIRRIGQQCIRIFEILCKAEQIAIFLIDLADILLPAVNAQRAIAHYADCQHFPHSVRRKVLPVQQHFLGVHANTPGKILIQPLPVGMIYIGQCANGLCKDRIAGDQPHHHLRLSGGQGIKNPPNGSAGHKSLAAAGGHLHANMGRTFNRVIIGRYSAEANGHILGKPVFPPRGKQIGSTVDAVQVGGEVTHDLFLIVVKFHHHDLLTAS